MSTQPNAPCLCTYADDVCPFRGPTGKPQCEEPTAAPPRPSDASNTEQPS